MTFLFAFPAQAQRLPEGNVCRNLGHCVEILKTHAPDEFDYEVLAAEFRRFGPRGTDQALGLMQAKDIDVQTNAAAFLHQFRPRLTDQQLSRLIQSWPSSSGMSRLIDLIADTNSPAVIPVLKSALLSGDVYTVNKAYETLERRDARQALITLQGAVFELNDGQFKEALALSRLISMLDERAGGETFKRYAMGLAQDNRARPMANLVGMDAALSMKGLDPSSLSNSQTALKAFETLALETKGHRAIHWDRLPILSRNNPVPWLNLGMGLHKRNPEFSNAPLLEAAFQAGPAKVESLLEVFLKRDQPYPHLANAMIVAHKYKPENYLSRIKSLAENHSVSLIRALPSILENPQWKNKVRAGWLSETHPAFRETIPSENGRAKKCAVKPIDFRERISEVPFFDWSKVPERKQYVHKNYISSAWPRLDGWLIGFDKGEWSVGMLFVSHDMTEQKWIIKDKNIKAIIPFYSKGGELNADQYWVVSQETFLEDRKIYILSTKDKRRNLRYVGHVPERAGHYGRLADNSLEVGYVRPKASGRSMPVHPPLRLHPDGTLTRACE